VTNIRAIFATMLFLATAVLANAQAQDKLVIVRRTPDEQSNVELFNVYTKQTFTPFSGDYFEVPPGYYLAELVRDDKVYYSVPELINSRSSKDRVIHPQGNEFASAVGISPDGFSNSGCSAVIFSSMSAIFRFGFSDDAVLNRIIPRGTPRPCQLMAPIDFTEIVQSLTGAYGETDFGLAVLHIDRMSPTDGISTAFKHDFQNGFLDVVVLEGKVYVACQLLTPNELIFCDSEGEKRSEDELHFDRRAFLSMLEKDNQYWRVYIDIVPIDSSGVERGHWTEATNLESVRTIEQQLSMDAKSISRTLDDGVKRLKPVKATTGGGMNFLQDDLAYSTQDLLSLKSAVQTQTRAALKGQELHPLRRHFDASFDKVELSSSPTVSADSAGSFIQMLRSIVSSLTSVSNDLSVDLVFLTQPAETEGSSLTISDCERCARIFSQGGSHRFFRGKYDYVVLKKGFKEFKDTFDLVDDPDTRLVCKLAKATAKDDTESECAMQSTQ
jgi:hypothetical protein